MPNSFAKKGNYFAIFVHQFNKHSGLVDVRTQRSFMPDFTLNSRLGFMSTDLLQ